MIPMGNYVAVLIVACTQYGETIQENFDGSGFPPISFSPGFHRPATTWTGLSPSLHCMRASILQVTHLQFRQA